MKITKKLIERITIYCDYHEEPQAVDYLKSQGYKNIDFYHCTDMIKVTGEKELKVEKGEIK